MKTWILDDSTDETGRSVQHPDGTYEHLSATEAVHAVQPVKPVLMDEQDVVDGLNQQIKGLLADAEALNDEVERLREVARRAQQREVKAVRQNGQIKRAIQLFVREIKGCL